MPKKVLPFNKEKLESIIEQYGSPLHIYDEKAIRDNIRKLYDAFSIFPDFKEYFAVKATPNPSLLKILMEEGCGADCSSIAELIIAEKVGLKGEYVYLTSNDTPIEEFQYAKKLGAVLNLDDISHIDYIDRQIGLPEFVSFRYNPGPLRSGNVIIGNPEEAKYGFTREQLFEGYKMLKDKGVKKFGIHTMIASNELDINYFYETSSMMFDLIGEIKNKIGVSIEVVNLGGGLGIPYKENEEPIDLYALANGIKKLYDEEIIAKGLLPCKIALESGRMITGPYGYLVAKAIHKKETYKNYVGLDASMANLMRPALYGSYHHITVMGKEDEPMDMVYDITGSLCENNDKFAIDRKLPKIDVGDILAIHDAGAHGHAMGFNYNGKLRSAEVLLRVDGSTKLIRRHETLDDYFATLDFDSL